MGLVHMSKLQEEKPRRNNNQEQENQGTYNEKKKRDTGRLGRNRKRHGGERKKKRRNVRFEVAARAVSQQMAGNDRQVVQDMKHSTMYGRLWPILQWNFCRNGIISSHCLYTTTVLLRQLGSGVE